MMGKQIQLYLVPEDVADYESAIKASGALILKRSSTEPCPTISDSARVQTPVITNVDGYIVRPCDVKHVAMRAVPTQSHWTVDALHSPVIEFFGCHFDGKTLKRGRLFYDQGFYDDAGTWVEKPKDFDSWAKDIVRLATRMFKKDHKLDALVGPKTKDWQTKWDGRFVSLSFATASDKPTVG